MATIRIAYVTSSTAQQLTNIESQTDGHSALNRVENLNAAMNAGAGSVRPGSVEMSVDENATEAVGTITCASVQAADTVHVGNVLFTAVTGTPAANQFKVGVSDTADALSLATAINAIATLSPYLTAARALGVVTITAKAAASGVLGNLLQLSSSNNTRLAAVIFTGGVNDPSAKTFSF